MCYDNAIAISGTQASFANETIWHCRRWHVPYLPASHPTHVSCRRSHPRVMYPTFGPLTPYPGCWIIPMAWMPYPRAFTYGIMSSLLWPMPEYMDHFIQFCIGTDPNRWSRFRLGDLIHLRFGLFVVQDRQVQQLWCSSSARSLQPGAKLNSRFTCGMPWYTMVYHGYTMVYHGI